jgi:hypothetical protein
LYLHGRDYCSIEVEWQVFLDSVAYRETLLAGVEQARQHQATGWIADYRRMGPLQPEDLEWAATHVLPQLVELGVRRMALIEPEDQLNAILLNDAFSAPIAKSPIELRRFTDAEAARTWACGDELDSSPVASDGAPLPAHALRLLYTSEFLDLRLLHCGTGYAALEAEWHGKASTTQLQEGTVQAMVQARVHHIRAWISNDQQLARVGASDVEWVKAVLLPMLLDIGVRRFALLESKYDAAREQMAALADQLAGPIYSLEFRRFTDIHEARAWACEEPTETSY